MYIEMEEFAKYNLFAYKGFADGKTLLFCRHETFANERYVLKYISILMLVFQVSLMGLKIDKY